MIVIELLGVSHGTGCVRELNLGVRLGGLDHVGLVTEGISEYKTAALVNQVESSLFTSVGLVDVGLEDALYTEVCTSSLGSVDEVEVIGGVLIMQEDETRLEVRLLLVSSSRSVVFAVGSLGAAAGSESAAYKQSN